MGDVTAVCVDQATWDRFERGELSSDAAAEVRAHLATCTHCGERYLRTGETVAGAAAPVEVDEAGRLCQGDRVGRYVILERLASGGMGSVYAAFDPKLDRKVALKLLSSRLRRADAAGWQLRFEREAQALARLLHPNVVVVHDAGIAEGHAFIAMELVEGRTLKAWCRASKRSWREVIAVFCAAGRGLAAAHAAGVVHRDFKPDNVMVGHDGRVRVTDFGIAFVASDDSGGAPATATDDERAAVGDATRAAGEHPARVTPHSDPAAPLTHVGTVMGTPGYMPPEQLQGRRVDARSDQFSFCASLYEALYGQRAFAGDDAAAVRDSVLGGRVRKPPRDARVPARLHRILLRGLATEATARHPSLDALIAELEYDPGAQRRRLVLLGVGVIGAVALVLGYRHVRHQQGMVCQGAERRLTGLWDDARRGAIHAAFVGTGAPWAESTYQSFARAVDQYAQAWVKMHTDACEATRLRGEQSEELLDLRMQCLDHRLEDLKAQLDVFAVADAQTLMRAVPATQTLGRIDECADTATLRRPIRLPSDPAARSHITELAQQVSRARALGEAGRFADGLRLVAPAAAAAEKLRYRPLQAEMSLSYGELQDGQGDYRGAADHFINAALAAEAGRDDVTAARSWIRLVWILGEREGKYAEAHERARYAEAAIERVESAELRDVLTAELLRNLGVLEFREGQYDRAFADGEKALSLFTARQGAESSGVAQCLADLGDARMEQGRYEEALGFYGRALALREKTLGPAHPHVALVLNNEGIVYKNLGRYEQAIATYRRALDIREKTLGPDHPHVGAALSNLAEVLARQGKYVEALADDRRALGIFERAVGAEHPDVADVLDGIGDVLLLQGNLPEALEQYRRALAIDEKALGPHHPALAAPLAGIGRVLLAQHQPAAAMSPLERALQIRLANAGDALELADTRFALARALDAAGQRPRARDLVHAARESYVASGEVARARLTDADAWLAQKR